MNGVNTNTIVVPLTVVASVALGTWVLANSINTKFSELRVDQERQGFKIEKMDIRIANLENLKTADRWTNVDMFKWAVHLQQNNSTIKVPEPKHEE